MNWFFGMTVALLVYLLAEAALVRRAGKAISHRILVTGTRGKTGLTRLLVAGIRAIEPQTWGKTTGDAPILMLPDGTERPLKRRGPARLHEQMKLLMACRRRGARCLVLESMTISPEAMQAESRLVRPTLTVMTNVRDDRSGDAWL